MEESKTMYPRVKVREEKEEDEEFVVDEGNSFVQEKCSLPLFRILESVSLEEHSLPGISSPIDGGKESQYVFSPSFARVLVEAAPSISMSKGGKNNKEIDEETRIRASSVPRPRAVISSPDNDWMIGSRNRLASERSSNLKKCSLDQKSPAQVKVNCIKAATHMSTRKGSHESGDRKNRLNEKKGPQLTVPNQKTYLRKGKPSLVAI
ncbi:uncharacterized protein LOC122669838 [Telopea speciosissima]|uniref:uncharacterized protein LOC122669838 n=1 Tax=Telopea speciosissima TaxID=54955 RepID=UPI001CC6880D|nr:uncharacterized protein LOC122669838 [Telopea speciosissima]XP_043722643.1 uncharacterized protein LOC122669838 [Telopea speciosissima]